MPRFYGVGTLFLLALPEVFAATLTGRVVDAKTAEPLAKATVIATGDGERTTTDDKGEFKLSVT